jgi:hypothetical protein
MRAEDIAVAFAERLGSLRALTTEETDMLMAVVATRRREWTPDEIETLRAGRARHRLMPAIARDIGRSPAAVRTMWRDIKRKERVSG